MGGNFHLVVGAAGFKPINFGTLLIVLPSDLLLVAAYLSINLVFHVFFTYFIFLPGVSSIQIWTLELRKISQFFCQL
jgi:hypothetical protein